LGGSTAKGTMNEGSHRTSLIALAQQSQKWRTSAATLLRGW